MLDKIAAMKERNDATTHFRMTAARLRSINADLLQLAEAVAQHFADTDSPLGNQARAAIAKARQE